MEPTPDPSGGTNGTNPTDDDHPPLFGTWPRAYAAVIGCALLVMALIAWFSSTGW